MACFPQPDLPDRACVEPLDGVLGDMITVTSLATRHGSLWQLQISSDPVSSSAILQAPAD